MDGTFPALAVDGQGNVLVVTYDTASLDLELATRSGDSWSVEAVDTEGDVGRWPSLVVAGSGDLTVAYVDATDTSVELATRSAGGAWTIETVDGEVAIGTYREPRPSLAVDSGGAVHVAHDAGGASGLRLASRPASGDWTIETFDSAADEGTSIACDADDGVHLASATGIRASYRARPACH